jgi:8-oxo-dGTP pyrophosphatase MutT (NUDIX family)
MLDRATAISVVEAIKQNHTFDDSISTLFHTDTTTGYVPVSHVEIYANNTNFKYDPHIKVLEFADHVRRFDAKSNAMKQVTEELIETGLIIASTEPHFQERAVGDASRTDSETSGEFKINRAYYRHYGFQADGVFLQVILEKDGEEPRILLQQRAARVEAGGTFDFAAGGAVKFPQTIEEAVNKQALEELGVDVSNMKYMDATEFMFQTPEKDWVTSNRHNLFEVRTNKFAIGDYDAEEVQGFEIATPEQVIEYCATGRINRQNVQSMMTSMVVSDLMPKFDGAELIVDAIKPHMDSPKVSQTGQTKQRKLVR